MFSLSRQSHSPKPGLCLCAKGSIKPASPRQDVNEIQGTSICLSGSTEFPLRTTTKKSRHISMALKFEVFFHFVSVYLSFSFLIKPWRKMGCNGWSKVSYILKTQLQSSLNMKTPGIQHHIKPAFLKPVHGLSGWLIKINFCKSFMYNNNNNIIEPSSADSSR